MNDRRRVGHERRKRNLNKRKKRRFNAKKKLFQGWLNSTNDYAQNYNDQNYQANYLISNAQHTFNFCFNSSIQCNFEQMLNKCDQFKSSSSSFHLNDVDVLFLIKWLEFVLLVIAKPCLCILGLFNSLLVILLLKNKSKKSLFKEVMYKHILLNTIFNMAYSFISLLGLLNTCLFYGSNIYCSHAYQTYSGQYFKIIGIDFVGSVLKFCGNVSYLFYSFSRYILVSNFKASPYINFKMDYI